MADFQGCRHRSRRRRLELADLVRRYGDRLRAQRPLTGVQLAALNAIERCRTPALGGTREVCSACGHQRLVFRSCRNRHCPKCQTLRAERWCHARIAELLPVDYVHVVFTLPHALHPLALSRPRLVYGLLFRCAADTLLALARDPRHLGAEPGILTVLHTWGQNLSLHIHLHCIVTRGGLDPTRRRWIHKPGGFLFPVRALSKVFRGKYLDRLRTALETDATGHASVPFRDLRKHAWVVYAKKPFAGPRKVLQYLARYTHRVALTNNRLLGLEDGVVRLRYRDYAHGNKNKVLRIHAHDLLQRFLLHVLPHGFRHIRHYGLLGNRHKAIKLAASRRYFGLPRNPRKPPHRTSRGRPHSPPPAGRCPRCGAPRILLSLVRPPTLTPRARAPTGDRG